MWRSESRLLLRRHRRLLFARFGVVSPRNSKSEVTKLATMWRVELSSRSLGTALHLPHSFSHLRVHISSLAAMVSCLGARLSFGRNIHLPPASDGGRATDPHCTRNLPLFLHFSRRLGGQMRASAKAGLPARARPGAACIIGAVLRSMPSRIHISPSQGKRFAQRKYQICAMGRCPKGTLNTLVTFHQKFLALLSQMSSKYSKIMDE